MIVEGQIHGGLTQGLRSALHEEIPYDEDGNNLAFPFMDYLVPTAVETPAWETGHTVTPSPHHPLGAKGVGESATVEAPPVIANAVVDVLAQPGGDAYGYSDSAESGFGGVEREGGGKVMGLGRGRSARRVASVRWSNRIGEWGGRVSVRAKGEGVRGRSECGRGYGERGRAGDGG